MHAMASQATTSDVYTRPVLLKVTVEVTATKSDTILVREGDDAASLATGFCRKHGLQTGLIRPLTAHIQENLDLALATTPLSPGSYGSLQAQLQPVSVNSSGPLPAPGSAPHRPVSQEGRVGVSVVSSDFAAGAAPSRPSRSARQSGLGPSEPIATAVTGREEPVSMGNPSLPTNSVAMPSGMYGNAANNTAPHNNAIWNGDSRLQQQNRHPSQVDARVPRAHRLSNGGHWAAAPTPAPAPVRASSCQRAAASSAPTTPRYERLHEDAAQRQCRLQRLRQQVERQQDELCLKSGAQTPPGTLRSHAWHRSARGEGGVLGERLYRDAEDRRIRMERMQLQRNLEQRLSDMEDVTFRPAIYRSQRTCRGVPRIREDSAERLSKDGPTARRREQLRLLQLAEEMNQCTFQPQIDARSAEMMDEKLRNIQWKGTLHDALYEDALRRQKKQAECESILPEGVTFQPSVGNGSRAGGVRPTPRDATEEDFYNRLAYEKAHRLAAKQQEEGHTNEASTSSSFRPSLGRPPLVERHGQQVAIGDFLYEAAREKASQQMKREAEEAQQIDRIASASHVSDVSRALFEESKRRRYHDLFTALVAGDPDGLLRVQTANLDALDQDLDLLPLLEPMLRSLSSSSVAIRFDEFADYLDEQRRICAAPTAGAVARRPSKSEASRSTPAGAHLSATSTSALSVSVREGSRERGGHRPEGVALHDQLHRERELREQRLQEQRAKKQQEELAQCTFQLFRPPARGKASASPPPPNGTARRSQSAGPGAGTARRAAQRQQQTQQQQQQPQQPQQAQQPQPHQSQSQSQSHPEQQRQQLRSGRTPRPSTSNNNTSNNNVNSNTTANAQSQAPKSTPPHALVRQLLQADPTSHSSAGRPISSSALPPWREARETETRCISPSSATTVGPNAIAEVSVAEFGRDHLLEVDAAVNRARVLLSMTRDSPQTARDHC